MAQVEYVVMHTTHQTTPHLGDVFGRRGGKELTVEDMFSLLQRNCQTMLFLLGAAMTEQTREYERLHFSQY